MRIRFKVGMQSLNLFAGEIAVKKPHHAVMKRPGHHLTFQLLLW